MGFSWFLEDIPFLLLNTNSFPWGASDKVAEIMLKMPWNGFSMLCVWFLSKGRAWNC